MIRPNSLFGKSLAVVLALTVFNISVPLGAVNAVAPDPKAPKASKAPRPKMPPSRPLWSAEMRKLQGSVGENPYIAGASKWAVNYKGVDAMTGNFSASGTDLTFEGGYGIPVNVTRSYSANNGDEGPLGRGWTLSVDIRNTAGGLLKGPSSAPKPVPVGIKERPAAQTLDPNAPMGIQPPEAVISTDSSGQEETIQRDVDGVLTTPPWDKNTHEAEYETVTLSGNVYTVLKRNVTHTAEGTTYVYEKKGYYPYGTKPYNNPSATAEASNVLKPVSATDRHGNVTLYTYGTSYVTLEKANGTVSEYPITGVSMPNGHQITFTWGSGTSATENTPVNRIWKASDGVRTVKYGYGDFGVLTKVTTPAGKETTYEYGAPYVPEGWTASYEVAGPLLTKITDPRGMATSISYQMERPEEPMFLGRMPAPIVYCLEEANGCKSWFRYRLVTAPGTMPGFLGGHDFNNSHIRVVETQDANGGFVNRFAVAFRLDETAQFPVVEVQVDHGMYSANLYGTGDGPIHVWQYDIFTQNLMKEWVVTVPQRAANQTLSAMATLEYDRRLIDPEPLNRPWGSQRVTTETVYNFMGSPLSKSVTEATYTYSGTLMSSVSRPVEYAYWGASKYYQQMAVRSKKTSTTWRYSFTDYFDDQATGGKKGMTYRVYDDKRADFAEDTGISVPAGTPSTSYWRYRLRPVTADVNKHTAEFDYDSKGRTKDIWKLQSTTTTPWTYVQTHTEYGADSSPTWGAATSVVEDYGTGKINRTTQTSAYDSIGRATDVIDAAGHQFHTNYDLDGQIQSVYRVDGSHNDAIVSYVYGSSGITNGVPTQVTDGLSGVVQAFTYNGLSSGGATGMPSSVTETNGSDSYSVSYTYNAAGDRQTATYATPNGTTKWGYYDYVPLGEMSSPSRVFRTLNKLDSSGNPTSEEFHYQFDSSGRLQEATFAMSPQSGHGYEANYPAATRARAHYTYDPGGRTTNVEHYWDTWGSTSYTSEPILGNHCDYDAVKGLKSQSDFYVKNPSSNAWLLERSEEYGYDADLDYLTSADYNDGLANENPTWSYDAAGNRGDATAVDNLNRATTIGGVSRTYDILGNTLTKGTSFTYTWDCLNRMTSLLDQYGVTNYAYRADGMRVTSMPGTRLTVPPPVLQKRFRYDGQMPIETSTYDANSTALTVDRNGIGARGTDYMSSTTSSGTAVSYPVYDAHGNMVATLAKSGGGYAISNRRAYDAWGGIRQGNTSGEPRGRYCASLGHVQDDEGGLLYMRARYVDPDCGRFICEDYARDGCNWFIYCANDPVNLRDASGKSPWDNSWRGLVGSFSYALALDLCLTAMALAAFKQKEAAATVLSVASAAAAVSMLGSNLNDNLRAAGTILRFILTNAVISGLMGILASGMGEAARKNAIGAIAVAGWTAHCVIIIGALTYLLMGDA